MTDNWTLADLTSVMTSAARVTEFTFHIPPMAYPHPGIRRHGFLPPAYIKWRTELRAQMKDAWPMPAVTRPSLAEVRFHAPLRGRLPRFSRAVRDAGDGWLWEQGGPRKWIVQFAKAKHSEALIEIRIAWKDFG